MQPPSGSRRRSRRLLVAAAAACLALFLTACPSDSGPDGGNGGSGNGKGPQPARGGELVVAYPHEPATLNPFVTGGDATATRDLVRPLMPALYRLGPAGQREPWLLESEPSGGDIGGTPWGVRVRLREDAVWSDGRPITATDLRFTWQAVIKSPKIASRDGYDRLADVVVESSKTARLVFGEPFARWRDLFSAGLGVLPAHVLGKTDISAALGTAWPVSGGPFVLAGRTAGLELVYERNPRAWGEDLPLLDRIRVVFVPDVITALELFRRGEVDVLGPYVSIEFARRAAAAVPGSTVSRDRGSTWAGLFLNVKTRELTDVRVRRALAFLLDRAIVVEGLVREMGGPLDSPSSGDVARTDGSFARYAYDPTEAERLLDAAGWKRPSGNGTRRKGGRELSVTLAGVESDDLSQRVLRAFNAQASGIGVDLNLVSMDFDQLNRDWLPGSRFEAAVLTLRDPPGGGLRTRFGVPETSNASRLSDKPLVAAFDAADRTLDDDAAAVDGPSLRLASLVPVIPLYVLEVVLAARPGVNGVSANASADGFLWNAEAWWRAGGSGPSSPSPTGS